MKPNSMPCQKHKELLERWWNDRLTEAERTELESKLAECEDCRRELEGSRELWDLMGYMTVPEPSADMQVQFDSMLESFKASEAEKASFAGAPGVVGVADGAGGAGVARVADGAGGAGVARVLPLFSSRPWMAAAVSAGLLLGGFGLGLLVNKQKPEIAQTIPPAPEKQVIRRIDTVYQVAEAPAKPGAATATTTAAAGSTPGRPTKPTSSEPTAETRQLAALTAQMHEMREMMMMSLLQNPSASERIRAVSYTSDIGHVNPNIAAALLATLNSDPNINVRLSTLEALTHFARDPVVREGLIQSILQQESPLVQAALADVMLKLQEKRAVQPFRKLLQQKDLNQMVRTKIEQTITQLT
jgi:hypothetical protein